MALPGRKRQFVFVSHANRDKTAIKPIVDALIASGLKVWLDSPDKMGFSSEETEAHFIDLRGGRRWRDQIYDAANEAMCMLACWSKTSSGADREVIRDEVAIGRSQRKLVSCRIDDVDPQLLPNQLGEEQFVDLFGNSTGSPLTDDQRAGRIRRLVEDVRLTIARISEGRLKSDDPRDTFAPYLADRRTQETVASQVIRESSKGSVQALFITGPRNECVDQFRERLTRFTSSAALANGYSWHELLVSWPPLDNVQQFRMAYEANLAASMRCGIADLQFRLKQGRPSPLAVVSVLGMSEWKRGHRDLTLEWLRFWKDITSNSFDVKIVPIMAVELPEVKPGWTRVPPVRSNGISADRIWNDIGDAIKLASSDPGCIPLHRLDALSPISDDDARGWLREHIAATASQTWRGIERQIDLIFSGSSVRKGVAMKDFANRIREALVRSGGG